MDIWEKLYQRAEKEYHPERRGSVRKHLCERIGVV